MEGKKVNRIGIKSSSGYVTAEEAYEDIMILDRKSIHYRIRPGFQSYIDQSRDWTFITSNMEYELMFESLSDYVLSVLEHRDEYFPMVDVGSISFSVTYDDNTSDFFEFERLPSDFQEGLSWIRGYVPPKEDVPEMLKTWEDYCEDNETIVSTVSKLYNDDGVLSYEGCTRKGKPFGAGTAYYPDGSVYQEGLFNIKGFLYGKEYYPDGNLRFEGSYTINNGYGPNYPVYGTAYDKDENKIYTGLFRVKRSGLGFPMVQDPAEYGSVVQPDAPDINPFMWIDENEEG